MKKILSIISLFLIISCSSSQKVVKEAKCPKIYKNKYTEILSEKYETIYNNDTISFNEIRFECVFSAFYSHKVMFDKFGKWDKTIYPSNKKHPILVWEKVELFSNGEKYNVYTNGMEEWKHIYASVMVFDENNKDLLSNESTQKERLTNYFADLIKNHKTEKRDFYEAYWTTVDPEHWENIK
ncbi:hypothetical protein DFR65_102114 [Oceanihabitans sediminis]|uniref:Uncharacterized protein n=2 Tax=Oceanihabitans sediminis TaxID=1812012 RepID=A0A368P5F7_9FLAO|nr:hypothetical protein [Oceanihabitans sediminis]MDX1773348.1 hypothetical protein [Oceanihabitans sediminis]RBP32779.1 hypothetical protein DFR65_102114 [Oceanihabitans sediminis]RCU57686.1 hypothetical protein DU428_07800 [Oceanihabitans sediminis]